VNVFSTSDTVVVTLQYLLLQGASLGLVLSLRRWCGVGERTVAVLMAFVLLDPVIPYVANYISSDALFIGLSLIWLTVLMGILRAAGWRRLALQVVLLFVIFNLRYAALFYPAVAALMILLARRGWRYSAIGVVASIGVVVAGTLWIKSVTRRETGADLFSAFSGWQMANNVLNLYPHIPVDTAGLPSAECRVLAGYVSDYFVGTGRTVVGPGVRTVANTGGRDVGAPETRAMPEVTTAYMWLHPSPLHLYMEAYKRQHKLSYFDAWNRVGVVFSQYGYFVARKHPVAFLRYYGWPSAKVFFLTGLDNMAAFNEGKPDVDSLAANWFRYPGVHVKAVSVTLQSKVLAPMAWTYTLLNLSFVITALLFLSFRTLRQRNKVFTACFRLASAFLLANAFFSIFATPSVFRYQVLPLIVLFVFTVAGVSKSRVFSVT
jgi:hypothetical protein